MVTQKEVDDKLLEILNDLYKGLEVIDTRFKKLTEVIYNYLEASSSIALSAVKANLKSI